MFLVTNENMGLCLYMSIANSNLNSYFPMPKGAICKLCNAHRGEGVGDCIMICNRGAALLHNAKVDVS